MTEGLRLENISRTFVTEKITTGVSDINLEIPAGDGFSLLGPSGCGKTTTLRIIGGFESVDSGRLLHNGVDITDLKPQKRNIRTVFQKYALFPHLSVRENIAFGLRMQKRPEQEIKKRVEATAELVDITRLLERPILKLSGGEQQRVALARALITEPEVLLLDEPFSALDLKLRERMQLELLALKNKVGTTFIFVTHDQTEAMVLSDRIAVMNKGKIEQVGTPEEVYHKPVSKFVAQFIGQANFLCREQASSFQGASSALPQIGARQEWMVRAENFVVRKSGAPVPAAHVGMAVEVLETAFLGEDWLYKVRCPAHKNFIVKSPGYEPNLGQAGDQLLVHWEVDDTWVVQTEA